jgi:hypothetical protein
MRQDALYFPHIEIPNVDWVKSTLLFWDHIYRIVPRSYTPSDNSEIEIAVDAGLIRPINLEPQDVSGIADSFRGFLDSIPFIPAGLEDVETSLLHPEKIDAMLYPALEKYAKGGTKGDWLELPSDLVRGYMFFLSNEVAKRRQLERCTDDKMSFGVAGYFSENGNFPELLYDRESSGFYSSLIFNDLFPFNISNVPIQKIIKVAHDTCDERKEFRTELIKFTNSLCECESKDHADTIINDFKQDLLLAKNKLKASQGFLGEYDRGSLFTMAIPVAITAFGSIIAAGADPFSLHTLAPSVLIGAIAGYADFKKTVSTAKNPCGAAYLVSLEKEFAGTGRFPAFDRYLEEFVND